MQKDHKAFCRERALENIQAVQKILGQFEACDTFFIDHQKVAVNLTQHDLYF